MGYIVKEGDTLSGIASKHSISVDQLVAWNGLIEVGQTLIVKEPTTPPPPTTPGTPVVGGSVKFYEIGPGGSVVANKVIQTALNYEFGGVVIDGIYGPQTMAAYIKWQTKVGESAKPWDGVPGQVSLPPLAAKYKFAVDYSAPPKPPAGAEPAHNYTRTTYGGRTVNQRTKDMLEQARTIYGKSFPITQGSYNRGGVAASAGTHDGGGVVDIGSSDNNLLRALRQVGFAAWVRSPAEGFSYHIHACAIGDREMAAGAKNQITAYYNGRNGLANNGRDSAPASVGRPYPSWAAKYGAPVN